MTIAQAQSEFLKSGGFRGGIDRPQPNELSAIEQELSNYITTFLNKASDNLNKTNSITTGELDRSLSFEIVPTNTGYLVNFKALEYFKFVDKGVRGAGSSEKNNTSPYKFKKINPSPDHVTAIKKWIISNNLTALVTDINKYGATRRERKGETMPQDRAAYVIARSIKRKGITATNFWSDAFDETFKDFGVKMSAALGKSITVNLEQMKEDLANFKGSGAGRGTLITTR
jgi:hypothetical protein